MSRILLWVREPHIEEYCSKVTAEEVVLRQRKDPRP
jgi:hypothetical protein